MEQEEVNVEVDSISDTEVIESNEENNAPQSRNTSYSHPATHAATMITTDANNRFVSDTEKSNWNNKANNSVATSSSNGLLSSQDKQKIDRIDNNFDIVYDTNTETIQFKFR